MATTFKSTAASVSSTRRVFELMPGDVAIAFAGDQLKTLLGSCVSVILTDVRRTVGVMCHIVHVGRPTSESEGNTAYAQEAMREMFRLLSEVGLLAGRCEAFVYGGGNMFPQLFSTNHVGANNAQWTMDFLSEQGIKVIHTSLGGPGYRKVSWEVGHRHPAVETIAVSEEGVSDAR